MTGASIRPTVTATGHVATYRPLSIHPRCGGCDAGRRSAAGAGLATSHPGVDGGGGVGFGAGSAGATGAVGTTEGPGSDR
jgi:hypothetical protein